MQRQKLTIEAMNRVGNYALTCGDRCAVDDLRKELESWPHGYLLSDSDNLEADGVRVVIRNGRMASIRGETF